MAKNWIAGAIKRPGALKKKLGKITPAKLASAGAKAKKTGDTRTLRQVNLAKTLRKFKKK